MKRVPILPEFKNVYIHNPEFKYIFTVDLGGRIIDYDENGKSKFASYVEQKISEPKKGVVEPLLCEEKEEHIDFNKNEEIYHVIKMDKSTIKSYIDPYLLSQSTLLRWFLNRKVAERLIHKSIERFTSNDEKIMRCDKFNKDGSICAPEQQEKCCETSYNKRTIHCNFENFDVKDRRCCPERRRNSCNEYINFHSDLKKIIKAHSDDEVSILRYFGDDTTSEKYRLAGIEVKLFRAGTLSILIRFGWTKPGDKLLLDDCLNYVRYPENIIIKQDECCSGPLNKFAQILSQEIIKDFLGNSVFEEIRNIMIESFKPLKADTKLIENIKKATNFYDTDNNVNLYVGTFCSKITKHCIHEDIFTNDSNTMKDLIEKEIINYSQKNVNDKDKNKDKDESDKTLYLNNIIQDKDHLCEWLNEKGIIIAQDLIDNIYEEFNKEKKIEWSTDSMGKKILIALANTTPEFLNYFKDPDHYVDTVKNIARGDEIIMLERRSWVIASNRLKKDDGYGTRYRIGIIECLLYCLEAIISTTRAIETFNENMEEEVKVISYDFNKELATMISKEEITDKDYNSIKKKLRKFVEIISHARSISPCEDIITSIGAHLKSMTAIKAVKSVREVLELNSLISLARERMKNYSHFLQTGHDILMAKRTEKTNWSIEILTWGVLILTGTIVFLTLLLVLKEFKIL